MKKALFVPSLIGTYLLSASIVLAEDIPITIPTPSTVRITDIGKLISAVIGIILIVAALAAFIYLILGGFQWITSGGDKSAVESAQHRIQAAILGLFIVFAAWAVMIIIGKFLGIDIFNPKIPTPF